MKMFENKFAPEPAPPRKAITVSILNLDAGERARQFGLDYSSAEMAFDNMALKFDHVSGVWKGMYFHFLIIVCGVSN